MRPGRGAHLVGWSCRCHAPFHGSHKATRPAGQSLPHDAIGASLSHECRIDDDRGAWQDSGFTTCDLIPFPDVPVSYFLECHCMSSSAGTTVLPASTQTKTTRSISIIWRTWHLASVAQSIVSGRTSPMELFTWSVSQIVCRTRTIPSAPFRGCTAWPGPCHLRSTCSLQVQRPGRFVE